MNYLLQKIIDAVSFLGDIVKQLFSWLLDSLLFIIKGVLWLIMDGFLTVITVFVQTLDYSALALQWSAAHGLIPSQSAYIMSAIGFPQMVTMIAAAYVIRLTLNLIPSWATRA